MIQIIIMSLIFMLISLMLMTLNYMISKKSFQDREKTSPFECGFDPISPNHMPFSTQFFLISLIFLIFDIEITLLIPLIYMFIIFNLPLILTSFLFMMILNYSLYIEYSEQSIDWKI